MAWRSVWLPRVLAAVALIVGVPLFLRSPPWCDITLYQLAGRNLLQGGVHYRDLFDTNLPGFVWAMTALHALFGASVVAVRAADLLVVFGVVALIDRLSKWAGATPAARSWTLASVALFYPFTVEMSHAQRDTWMALPGLAAVVLRLRRITGSATREPGPTAEAAPRSVWARSFCEGLLWGAGVWMKPHIVLIALVVWVLTVRRLAGEHPRPWRAAGADLLGNLLGGLAAAVPGLVWLVLSGAWDPFLDVFLNWNPGYMKLAKREFDMRVDQELFWFPPWSLWVVLTFPLALASVVDASPWSSRQAARFPQRAGPLGYWLPRLLWDKSAGADARFVRGIFAALYLVWVMQAFFVQRGLEYVHIPEVLLMIGFWAAHRWAWAPLIILWLTVTSIAGILADTDPEIRGLLERVPEVDRLRYLPRHPITNWERLQLWPACWRPSGSAAEGYALWDKLRLHPPHEASIGWEELAEAGEFLRSVGARDGEVIGWFDSPHAIYLILDLKPGFRFMHVHTAICISLGEDPSGLTGRGWVLTELRAAPRAKYAISDLEWTALSSGDNPKLRRAFTGPARRPPTDLLPAVVPYPNEFPWNQPTLFRTRNGTGRYIVHKIVTTGDDPPPAPSP